MWSLPLHIQQSVMLVRRAYVVDQGDQRDLGGVAAEFGLMEHRFASEQPADTHAVETARQCPVRGPCLDRVCPTGAVQLSVYAANPIIDPSPSTPRISATVQDSVEMGVHAGPASERRRCDRRPTPVPA